MQQKILLILLYIYGSISFSYSQSDGGKPSLEHIGSNAFRGATIYQGITMPSSLKIIDNEAFRDINIPCLDFSRCTNLEEIRSRAFYNAQLTTANLLNFSNSKKLSCCVDCKQQGASFDGFSGKVLLPDKLSLSRRLNSLTSIGDNAFRNATIGYLDLSVCSKLEEIGTAAFRELNLSDNKIIDLSVSSKLSGIGNETFYNSNLTRIYLPDSLENIGTNAFSGCNNLTLILSRTSEPPVPGNTVFEGVDKQTCKLRVPVESVDLYKAANQWKDFFDIDEINPDNYYDPDPDPNPNPDPVPEAADHHIIYTYDAAGNRIERDVITLRSRTVSTDEEETPLPFEDNVAKYKILIYPNPTKGQLRVDISSDNFDENTISGELSVFNLKGQLVVKEKIRAARTDIDLFNSPSGIYIMRININSETSSWKVIKE